MDMTHRLIRSMVAALACSAAATGQDRVLINDYAGQKRGDLQTSINQIERSGMKGEYRSRSGFSDCPLLAAGWQTFQTDPVSLRAAREATADVLSHPAGKRTNA